MYVECSRYFDAPDILYVSVLQGVGGVISTYVVVVVFFLFLQCSGSSGYSSNDPRTRRNMQRQRQRITKPAHIKGDAP